MFTRKLLCIAAFFVLYPLPPCTSQELVEVIHLSKDEAVKARKISSDLRNAETRYSQSQSAWRTFCQNYQAAHPELPGLSFASDLQLAFALKRGSGPLVDDVAASELSPEEQEQARSLQREIEEARRVLDETQRMWSDYKNEIVADHITLKGSGPVVTLRDGRSVLIPFPWDTGLAFTPDFTVAVPLRH